MVLFCMCRAKNVSLELMQDKIEFDFSTTLKSSRKLMFFLCKELFYYRGRDPDAITNS